MAAKQKGLALLSGLNHLTGDWEGFLIMAENCI
jgi:hypothetical protein